MQATRLFRVGVGSALVLCAFACFNPSADHRWGIFADAGTPPDPAPLPQGDAGQLAADAGVECATWHDCQATDAGFLPFCATRAPTCLAGRCVTECRLSRSCEVASDGCLDCTEPVQVSCPDCARARRCTMTLSTDDCPGRFREGAQFVIAAPEGNCSQPLLAVDGGARAGTWRFLEDGDALAHIPELGGWCGVQGLFTGVPRMAVHCPDCSFVEVGCE